MDSNLNKLVEMIEELAGDKQFVLNDLRRDGKWIYIELVEAEPVNEQLTKLLKE